MSSPSGTWSPIAKLMAPLLKHAALAPPRLKALLFRGFSKLHRAVGGQGPYVSNLGLSRGLEISFPSDPGPTLLYGTTHHQVSERGAILLLDALLDTCDGFIDIGASFGSYTYAAALWRGSPDVPILAVEPIPQLASSIRGNIQKNKLKNVTVFEGAVGAFNGVVSFQVDLEDSSFSSLIANPRRRQQRIDTSLVTLDRLCEQLPSAQNLIAKIDVENAEHEVFEGLESEAHRFKHFLVEVCLPGQKRKTVEQVCSRLKLYPYYINDFNLEFGGEAAEFSYNPGQFNWLLTKLNPEQLAQELKGLPFKVS